MTITDQISRHNYRSFLWHAAFLAIASAFMDVDTIIPSMLINAGGTSVQVGILTAILIGGTRLSQLFIAPYIHSKHKKKGMMLVGIYLRIIALAAMAVMFFYHDRFAGWLIIAMIFILMSGFSLGGAFATVSFTDILGKSILENLRKSFFSIRQIVSSGGTLLSAWLAGFVLRYFEYPVNYFAVFAIAAIFLSIASLGFWKVKETKTSESDQKGRFWNSILSELKNNRRLTWYLLITNTLGLNYAILPFILLLGKSNTAMNDDVVSYLLLAKMSGLIVAGIFIFFYSKKIKYDNILKLSLVLGVIFPLIAWVFQEYLMAYYIAFFIGGLYSSMFLVASNGILLEISSAGNRAMYAGISGAGNILPTLIPLLAGLIISSTGFGVFFISSMIIALCTIFFIFRLNCLK